MTARTVALLLALALLVAGGPVLAAPAQEITFSSTQLNPVQEQEWARNTLLKPFEDETGIRVRFIGDVAGPYIDRLLAEAKAGRGSVDVTGTLQGDFPLLVAEGAVRDVAATLRTLEGRRDRTFIPDLVKSGQIGNIQSFVPWMQATYLIAANKQALQYFPRDRNPNAMTYDDLLQWGENIRAATGQRRVGFPAGPTGLYGRFLHGYVYPSFTGSQVKKFKSAEAVEMWRYLRRLWGVSHPSSFLYNFMNEPLLLGEVWVAWDHVARLLPALRERPNDFVVLPSPAGPKGRSFLAVIAGLGIPRHSPNPEAAERLIEYLTRPRTQVLTLQGVAFFPTIREAAGTVPAGGLKVMADGVTAQATARDARTALLPIGLGARSAEFVPLYVDTFREIAVQGKDIAQTLAAQARKLEELYRAMNAVCPPPDPQERPCRPE
ncbi:MAG: ABC transporter substrate-binding protein [Armatimonadota bacterium]|nr:ABC transporter substrate-binding protein [Armatimonadota bacterium]